MSDSTKKEKPRPEEYIAAHYQRAQADGRVDPSETLPSVDEMSEALRALRQRTYRRAVGLVETVAAHRHVVVHYRTSRKVDKGIITLVAQPIEGIPDEYNVGLSFCSPRDPFSRRVGVETALKHMGYFVSCNLVRLVRRCKLLEASRDCDISAYENLVWHFLLRCPWPRWLERAWKSSVTLEVR